MHVSVLIAAYRTYNLPFSGQTGNLKQVIEQTLNLLFNLVTTLPKNSLYLRQTVHSKCTVSPSRCICLQLTNLNNANVNERNLICKATQQYYGVHRTMSHRFDPRKKQNGPTAPALAMEHTELPNILDAPEGSATTITTVNEASETGKRKNEETEEPGKNSRGKRRRGGGGKNLRPGERYIPPPQKRNQSVGFSQEHFDETSYYFEGGLRKVHPYYFDFKTYCKGRWVGKSLLEVFSSEFRAESIEYYKKAAKEGRIRLNETPVKDLSVVLRNNDHMRNTVHRHEPPVVGRPLEVLVDNGEVLVINKPASMPVHPCGRFRHNTVIFILGKEQGISELHTVHRLDRLTSGVLLFARTLEVSQKLDQLVRDRQLEKEYVCRVEGDFPEGELVCEEPILVVSFKVGLCRVDPKGKECRTVFQRLSFNGSTSVVRCLPLTGRTHQIRVHLQYLGFPILNDPIYGSSAWGPHRGKGGLVGKSDEELLKALVEEHRSKESLHLLDMPDDGLGVIQEESSSAGAEANRKEEKMNGSDSASKPEIAGSVQTESDVCSASKKPEELVQQDSKSSSCDSIVSGVKQITSQGTSSTEVHHTQDINSSSDSLREPKCHVPTESNGNQTEATASFQWPPPGTKDPLCSECKLVRPDPTAEELIMYLHALRYKGPDFEYSTCLPDWAKEDWVEDK